MMARKRKQKGKRNPYLLTGFVFAYTDPVILVNFDYSRCSWYTEGQIRYSDQERVIAYVKGYRTQFSVTAYRFQNVKPSQVAHTRLMNYVKGNPGKYKGWLHHINYYLQGNRTFTKQLLIT